MPANTWILPSAAEQYKDGRDISFSSVSGRDAELARLMAACPGLDAHLVLMEKRELGAGRSCTTSGSGTITMEQVCGTDPRVMTYLRPVLPVLPKHCLLRPAIVTLQH
jgi:hypothetical protein